MKLDRAIELTLLNAKDADATLNAYCESEGISLPAFCNQFALLIAQQFLERRIDYDLGDDVMNHLFRFMTGHFFLSQNDNTVPEPAWSIYLAFDRGEYWMTGIDLPNEVPSEKYTRPELMKLLCSQPESDT